MIIFIYVLFIIYESDENGKLIEFNRINDSSRNSNNNYANNYANNYSDNDNNKENFNTLFYKKQNTKTNKKSKTNIIKLEAGQYDENNNLITGEYQCSKCDVDKKEKDLYSYDEYNEYLKNTCQKPTEENPFMNPTVNDFGVEMPPEPCNVEDDEIKERIDESFNKNLFMDVSDLYEKQNSQRQFYTIPGSNIPDTINFANWLYSPKNTCKVNQSKCGSFEDIRYNR